MTKRSWKLLKQAKRVAADRFDDAKARIREFAAWTVFAPTADDIVAAIDLHTARRATRHARLVTG